jgi:hypothetical protein
MLQIVCLVMVWLVCRFTCEIISASDSRLILNKATMSFISNLSLALNLGTIIFCPFGKINFNLF